MNILLDECVDRRLSRFIVGHEVSTAAAKGWKGILNGKLLSLAELEFDVLVTVDRNMAFQQNVPRFKIAVVVLHAATNRIADLRAVVPALLDVLPAVKPGTVTDVYSPS